MRDENRQFVAREFGELFKDFMFRHGIKGRGGFVQDRDLSLPQIRSRQGDSLPLAAGKIDTAFKFPTENLFELFGKRVQ